VLHVEELFVINKVEIVNYAFREMLGKGLD